MWTVILTCCAEGETNIRACYMEWSQRYSQGLVKAPNWVREAYSSISDSALHLLRKQMKSGDITKLIDKRGQHLVGKSKLSEPMQQRILANMLLRPVRVWQELQTEFGEATPSLPTVTRFMADWKREHPNEWMYMQNPAQWRNKLMPAPGKADEGIDVCDLWEMDATKSDAKAGHGITVEVGGKRLSILLVIDVASRRAVCHLAENASGREYCALLRKAITQWDGALPEKIAVDWGKAERSTQLAGAIANLGIAYKKGIRVRRGNDKPFVERMFRTVGQWLETLPTYIGHNISDRRDIREQEREFGMMRFTCTAEDLQEHLDAWLLGYEQRPHSQIDKPPVERWAEAQRPVRKLSDERKLDLLLATVPDREGVRKVGKKGVEVDGGFYWHERFSTDLWVGKEVKCYYDPFDQDFGLLWVYTTEAQQQFICVAKCHERLGLNHREIALQARQTERQVRKAVRGIKEAVPNVATATAKAAIHALRGSDNVMSFPISGVEFESEMASGALARGDEPIYAHIPEWELKAERDREERERVTQQELDEIRIFREADYKDFFVNWLAGEELAPDQHAFLVRNCERPMGGMALFDLDLEGINRFLVRDALERNDRQAAHALIGQVKAS